MENPRRQPILFRNLRFQRLALRYRAIRAARLILLFVYLMNLDNPFRRDPEQPVDLHWRELVQEIENYVLRTQRPNLDVELFSQGLPF